MGIMTAGEFLFAMQNSNLYSDYFSRPAWHCGWSLAWRSIDSVCFMEMVYGSPFPALTLTHTSRLLY
jgi:hypothetical protein